jgi:hypothetical protein
MSCPHTKPPAADAAARKARGYPIRSKWRRTPAAAGPQTTACLYGRTVKVWYQAIDALWYSSAGSRLLRIVVVRDPGGRRRDDCFFSTDLALTPQQILETFALRWPLEVCFRDVKQFLGFEDPQNRVSRATQRTAPLIFYIYDLVLLWHATSGHLFASQSAIERPWFKRKTSVSFEDILRNLRQATWQEKIFGDPTLDAHTRKILQPLAEWVKAAA